MCVTASLLMDSVVELRIEIIFKVEGCNGSINKCLSTFNEKTGLCVCDAVLSEHQKGQPILLCVCVDMHG